MSIQTLRQHPDHVLAVCDRAFRVRAEVIARESESMQWMACRRSCKLALEPRPLEFVDETWARNLAVSSQFACS